MRKRLRKKLDKQRIMDSIDWCFGDATDVINEYMNKMSEFRERWSKRIGLAQAK